MPANLTPQYRLAEQWYKQATTLPEKIDALRDMMAIIPKHKGTEHLRAGLRSRMSKHVHELENPKGSVGGGTQPFNIRKEGIGQSVLIGLANSGKSELLNALTGMRAKVGDYQFTTQIPNVGMIQFENVRIQLIDPPSLEFPDTKTQVYGLIRNADTFIFVVDLTTDATKQAEDLCEILETYGFDFYECSQDVTDDNKRLKKMVSILANKWDSEGAAVVWKQLERSFGSRFPLLRTSCLDGTGLDNVGQMLFKQLGRMRIYTRMSKGDVDYQNPIVLEQGSTVSDAGERLHKKWKTGVKYASLWGSGKFDGQRVSREYVLSDGDIVELHS
ncbi:uncharacterized protein METZ01_LOCUS169149 [marine metagenome]|uniref:TGS domain-containing protein n=1 Tax=marine metagenome TaxID=408172 RepID=A0A382BR67_9ZZZZ